MKKLLLLLILSLGLIGTTPAGEVDTNILKLKALNSCESCNLQVGDLFEVNLKGADLSGADLFLAKLIKANLTGANLSGAYLKDANLSEATLCNTKTPWGVDDSGC